MRFSVTAALPTSSRVGRAGAFVITLLACLTLALLVAPTAPAAGGWASAGSMQDMRYGAIASPLPGGKVLVAGGFGRNSADVYDPASGTWAVTGAMHDNRATATATPLPGGKVLVAGGTSDGSNGLNSAEVYNPTSGAWTVTSAMLAQREFAVAAPLPGGKVLVAGGATDGNSVHTVSSAEVYDPATNGWSPTAPMADARMQAVAAPLPGGKVLVVGGVDTTGKVLSTTEVYDPATGAWSAQGHLNTGRAGATATPLADGGVLVAGGVAVNATDVNGLASAEVYDPASGTWNSTPPMHGGRLFAAAAPLPDGRVLVAGGSGFFGSAEAHGLASADVYDPIGDTWTATAPMAAGRLYPVAAPVSGGVLVAGGASRLLPSPPLVLASAEIYTPPPLTPPPGPPVVVTGPPAPPPAVTAPPVVAGPPAPRRGVARAARIARVKQGRARLKLHCYGSGACHGVVTLTYRKTTKHRGASRSAKRGHTVRLGRSKFSVRAHKGKTVRVKLGRRARKLLRRAGKHGITARLTGTGVRHRAVRLKPPCDTDRRSGDAVSMSVPRTYPAP